MRSGANPLQRTFVPARILLAEDDRELRALIASALRDDGFEVVAVEDGNTLVDHLADGMAADGSLDGYDLIISDIRMPGFTALEIMTGLRRLLASTPIVLITAFGDPKTHERARRLGAAAVFDKPFDVDELTRAVVKLLEERWRSST
jgi:CheY-like chemotaxis protein